MVETPKENREHVKDDVELRRKPDKDQKENRSYYYDDAYGYEEFVDHEDPQEEPRVDDVISSDAR
jgi:hypothetical protein